MNAIIIEETEIGNGGLVELNDERAVHIRRVLKAQAGSHLKAAVVDQGRGRFTLESVPSDETKVTGRYEPVTGASGAADILGGNLSMVLAMPRPKELKRILRFAAMAGFCEITLIRAWRVDKSYLKSPVITDAKRYFLEGLSQSGNYRLPKLNLAPLFRPFVEDVLLNKPQVRAGNALVLHPGKEGRPVAPLGTWLKRRTFDPAQKYLLIFGPEGGWIDFELGLMESLPLFSLGESIWTTQAAIQIATGQMLAWSQAGIE